MIKVIHENQRFQTSLTSWSLTINLFDKLKFDEKFDIAMHSRKHATSDVFETYLGLAQTLENLERI